MAAAVQLQADLAELVVVALARGGVPVGLPVALELKCPLDACVVRKLGSPRDPETVIGAVASGGVRIVDNPAAGRLGLTELEIAALADRQLLELARCELLYRSQRAPIDLRRAAVILVDDGIVSGLTMRAAIRVVREAGATRVLVAAPVGARAGCAGLAAEADAVVCPVQPEDLRRVSDWYENFPPVGDDEVQRCLATAPRPMEPVTEGRSDRRR